MIRWSVRFVATLRLVAKRKDKTHAPVSEVFVHHMFDDKVEA